jgi:polyisoprenoid-binding protein YceI
MATTKWVLDPAHSEVQFKVKHLMITTVTGHFRKFDLQVETDDDDFNKAKSIVFTSEIDSVDTNNTQRDTHIKSADFFSAEEYRHIKFVGKKLEKKADDKYVLTGDLTIRDITKPITLDVEFEGQTKDPWGGERVGFSARGKIDRRDFGLTWNQVLEAGGLTVGNDVKISIEAQAVKVA